LLHFYPLFIDDWANKKAEIALQSNNEPQTLDNLPWLKALYIGLFQVISMIPGVSRSASTIIGGITQGLNRKQAAEFSFLLAMPTMFAATCKSLLDYFKDGHSIQPNEWGVLLVGNVVAFFVALAAVRFFVDFLSRRGFRIFGYYRIFVGSLIIVLYILRGDQLHMF
jgi:undecaprenyl-diphosphatase